MQLIEWSEEFSVGHQDIDGQHKCLLDIVNTLALEIEQPSAKSLESILNSLVQYTAHHFSYEELIFKDAGYPESPSHKSSHRNFVMRVLELKERFEQGQEVDVKKLYEYLTHWLLTHICVSDKKTFAWIDQQQNKKLAP